MVKSFETSLCELQKDMVNKCLKYTNSNIEKVYIYCSYEDEFAFSDFFYQIDGYTVRKHVVNDAVKTNDDERRGDSPLEQQEHILSCINSYICKIGRLCADNNECTPTEMKIVYDAIEDNLSVGYRYDTVYSGDPIKTTYSIFNIWHDKIKYNKL